MSPLLFAHRPRTSAAHVIRDITSTPSNSVSSCVSTLVNKMPPKKKKNKMDNMTEEEKRVFLEQKLLAEEEERKKKEEMLSQFLRVRRNVVGTRYTSFVIFLYCNRTSWLKRRRHLNSI